MTESASINNRRRDGDDWLRLRTTSFRSRLLVGIEQYQSPQEIADVLRAADADVFITTSDPDKGMSSVLLTDLDEHLSLSTYSWVGTTSFARSKSAALRTARELRESFGIRILKLDVRDDSNTPDVKATIEAAATLLEEGWEVLPLIPPMSSVAVELIDLGVSALRLLAAPVGSGRGITDVSKFRHVIEMASIPVIAEGGIGSAAHVVESMEIGADAVLVNAVILKAADRARMARALRQACDAGRESFASRVQWKG